MLCSWFSNDCRSLEIVIRHVSPNEVDTDISKIYIRANKSCSPCCCCRPYMDIRLVEEHKKIAEIKFKIVQGNEVVGMMKKMSATLGEYFAKTDSYKISFPTKATT